MGIKLKKLEDQVVVITGGTSGIGLWSARCLAPSSPMFPPKGAGAISCRRARPRRLRRHPVVDELRRRLRVSTGS